MNGGATPIKCDVCNEPAVAGAWYEDECRTVLMCAAHGGVAD